MTMKKKQPPIQDSPLPTLFFNRHQGQKKRKKNTFPLPNSLKHHTEGKLAASEGASPGFTGVTVPGE